MGTASMLESNQVIDIFELRRRSADRNLDSLTKFIESISSRTATLRTLRAQLAQDRSDIHNRLGFLNDRVKDLREAFETEYRDEDHVRNIVESVSKNLAALESAIKSAKEHWQSISGLKLDPADVKNGNLALQKKIDDRKLALQKLAPPSADPKKNWKEMDELADFWRVSLDYLAGVSLRHDGLDMDVCGIADNLIRELKESVNDLEALAILGRDGCSAYLPQIVYLRFPEWTIWVLPLAAGELWRDADNREVTISQSFLDIWAERDTDLNPKLVRTESPRPELQGGNKQEEDTAYSRWTNKRFLDSRTVVSAKPFLEDCLTDIFGTYALGPAYVRSSVFLSLDPSDENDRIRAEIILDVMKRMNAEALNSHQANEFVQASESAWKHAVSECGPESSLSAEKLKQREDLTKWKDSFLNYLWSYQKLRFPVARWEAEKERWVEYFLSPNPSTGSADAPGTIRRALAAAWEARIRNFHDRSTSLTSVDIATRCENLCKQIAPRGGQGRKSDDFEPPPNAS
jgi:hypothetical protein